MLCIPPWTHCLPRGSICLKQHVSGGVTRSPNSFITSENARRAQKYHSLTMPASDQPERFPTVADDESNAPRLISCMSVMAAMSLLFMVLRFWCKKRYNKVIGWDDHILVISWVCSSPRPPKNTTFPPPFLGSCTGCPVPDPRQARH